MSNGADYCLRASGGARKPCSKPAVKLFSSIFGLEFGLSYVGEVCSENVSNLVYAVYSLVLLVGSLLWATFLATEGLANAWAFRE
jgi:hypothetical protein